MKMELFSRCLNAAQRKIRKEMEDLKDEMIFREEEWKKERNELKGRIEKIEMRLEEYNKNGQNNMSQENNTKDTSSLISTFSTFRTANKSTQSALGNSRNVNNTSNTNNNNNDGIMCHCQKTAIQLAVKKDGPSIGRLVYKCPDKLQGNGGCNFFLSTPDNAKSQDNTACKQLSLASNLDRNNTDHLSRAGTFNNDLGNTSANDVNCNQSARKWTVYKNGPNKGRQFYGYSKGTNPFITPFTTYNFSESGKDNAGNYKNMDLGNFTARRAGNNARRKKKRKCGNCGMEGHTKTKCLNRPKTDCADIIYFFTLYL